MRKQGSQPWCQIQPCHNWTPLFPPLQFKGWLESEQPFTAKKYVFFSYKPTDHWILHLWAVKEMSCYLQTALSLCNESSTFKLLLHRTKLNQDTSFTSIMENCQQILGIVSLDFRLPFISFLVCNLSSLSKPKDKMGVSTLSWWIYLQYPDAMRPCSKCFRATEANDEQHTYFKHELFLATRY